MTLFFVQNGVLVSRKGAKGNPLDDLVKGKVEVLADSFFNVFAYEGAVSLTVKDQKPHPNPVHGTSVEEEKHPNTKDLVGSLFELAKEKGVKLDWVNCGLCVDERGAGNWIDGPRRGGPPDFNKWVQESDATLVIPTK